jgi:hypothetical protein
MHKKPKKDKDKNDKNDYHYDCVEIPVSIKPLETYEIWQESFELCGKICDATLLGEQEATNFEEACILYFKNDKKFNLSSLTYYGSKLHPNQALATKTIKK